MSPNIKLNGYLSILIFGYVIILHSYLGHFCLLLDKFFSKQFYLSHSFSFYLMDIEAVMMFHKRMCYNNRCFMEVSNENL